MKDTYLLALSMWRKIYDEERNKTLHNPKVIAKKRWLKNYCKRMEKMYFTIKYLPNGYEVIF